MTNKAVSGLYSKHGNANSDKVIIDCKEHEWEMCALIPQLFSCLLMHGEGGGVFCSLAALKSNSFFLIAKANHSPFAMWLLKQHLTLPLLSSPLPPLSICTVNISLYLHAQTAVRHDNKRSSLIYQKICFIYCHLKCLLATKIIPIPNSLCKAWLLFTVMRLILVLWVIMMGRPVPPYISMRWMSCGTWCPVTAR